MSRASTQLFRPEALRHRVDRLHGTVGISTPVAWQVIGFLLLAALVMAVVFLFSASYSRVETVAGQITLDKGVATIVPSRGGVVSSLEVSDGQHVRAGDILARVRSEEDMLDGATAPDRIRRAVAEQDAQLNAQGSLLLDAANAEQARLREQAVGLSAELTSISSQIYDQRRLIEVAEANYRRVEQVAERGFISQRDLEDRQATLITRKQQLEQLNQLRASKSAAIAEAGRSIAQSVAMARSQIASAQSGRAALAQKLAEVDLARGYAIRSPIDGVVTAVTARLGQPATVQQQMMLIIPTGAVQRVELYVPTSASGFIRPGQMVRLAIDAFPYQQFGTLNARISDISTSTVSRQGAAGPMSVYLVTAQLERPWLNAFGRRQTISPGMTLSARIVTQTRSLIEWLFEPIFAVQKR